MLITLAYRIPRAAVDAVFGTVAAYPLTAEFNDAWEALPKGKWNGSRPKRPPYWSLATALSASTGQHVRLFGKQRDLHDREVKAGATALLVTQASIDYRLGVAVRIWERCVRRGDDLNRLAPLIPDPEPARPLGEYLAHRTGEVPLAPNWVFRIAAWRLMQRLAASPLRIDGHTPLALHVDTSGALLTWDDLISNTRRTAHAMVRISAQIVTRPGLDDFAVCFDAHLSRIDNRWVGIKNTWIARGASGPPVLRLPVRHRRNKHDDGWIPYLGCFVPEILEACDLEPIKLPPELPPRAGNGPTTDRDEP